MSMTPAQLLRGLAVVVVIVGWAALAHLSSAGDAPSDLGTALGVAPIAAALALLLWRVRQPLLVAAGGLGLLAGLAALWPTLRQNVALLYFVQHLGTNLALAALFGRTLFGPGEALVTQLARAVFPTGISERKRRYTRQVTIAWTVFFLSNALLSAGLFLLAPATVWSTFANLLSLPLIGAMFIGEHLCRRRVLPPQERPTFAQAIRAYRLHNRPPANPL